MITLTPEIETHWLAVQPFLDIHSEAGYDQAVERLNELLDKVGANESHPLYELLAAITISLIPDNSAGPVGMGPPRRHTTCCWTWR